MEIVFECKACDSELVVTLDSLTEGGQEIRCSRCDVSLPQDAGSQLAEAIANLATAMAEVRQTMRVEVVMESDTLPPPHGFDAAYTLPEERGTTPSPDSSTR